MTVTLGDFEIANGHSRLHQALDEESFELTQLNQEAPPPARAEWPTLYHERAARKITLSYPVSFPAAATRGEATMQARRVAIQCPKGGVLKEYENGTRHTYADAQITSIPVKRKGLTPLFVFNLEATNPTTQLLALDGRGQIMLDGQGQEMEYPLY